ncbi:MAG: sporulation transcriptional regulator SpoIIID, partial [Firmicutes bacterium]|nr:sporulation transcriptional regulator SpoIIID [Bacillota bacterium]
FERVLDVSRYILDTKSTVRNAATIFGVSKSTVHKDISERLPRVDQQMARKIRKVLDFNKAMRHLRGGEAMRQKYKGK